MNPIDPTALAQTINSFLSLARIAVPGFVLLLILVLGLRLWSSLHPRQTPPEPPPPEGAAAQQSGPEHPAKSASLSRWLPLLYLLYLFGGLLAIASLLPRMALP